MGKRAKEHRKKVQKRNERIAVEKKKFQKMYTEMLSKKLEELKDKYSATTENDEPITIHNDIIVTGETE